MDNLSVEIFPWKLYIKNHNDKDPNYFAEEPYNFTNWPWECTHRNLAIYEIQY